MCLTDDIIILKNIKIIDIKINNNKRKFTYITKLYYNDTNVKKNNIFMFPFYGKINKITIVDNDDDNKINSILLKLDNEFNKKINLNVYNFDFNIIQKYNFKVMYYKIEYFCKNYRNILTNNNICDEYIKNVYNNLEELNKKNTNIDNLNEFYVVLCIIENNNKKNMLNDICIQIDYELVSDHIIIPTICNYNNNYIYKYNYKFYVTDVKDYDNNEIIKNLIYDDYKFIDKDLVLFKNNNKYNNINGIIYDKYRKILFAKIDLYSKINNNIIIKLEIEKNIN